MASFLRGKQAGMQNDLSAGILPHTFAPDTQSIYGINSQIRHGGTSAYVRAPVADRGTAV